MAFFFALTGIHAHSQHPVRAGQPAAHQQRLPVADHSAADAKQISAAAKQISAAAKQIEEARGLRATLSMASLEKAIRLYEDSARQLRLAGKLPEASAAEREAGDVYLMMTRYREALALYKRALDLAASDVEARCLALGHRSRVYATTGKPDQAEEDSQLALTLCENHPVLKTRADVLEARGETLYYSQGKHDEALEFFERARECAMQAGDPGRQALALLFLAHSRQKKEPREAFLNAVAALKLSSEANDLYGVARTRIALASFADMAGKFELARCHCTKALPVFEKMANRGDEAVILNILAAVALATGDPQTSLKDYSRASGAFAGIKDELGELGAIGGMGDALKAMQQYDRLVSLSWRKYRLAQKAKSQTFMASALMDLAGAYQVRHEYGKAETLYRRAIKIFHEEEHNIREGDAWLRLANLQAAQGKYEEAISSLETARSLKQGTEQIEDMARTQYELAHIYFRKHRLEEALREIQNTIAIIESQRQAIASLDSRAQYFAFVHQYYSLYIEVLMALDKLHPEKGFMQLAFEASEKSKVRSLLDLLTASSQASPCEELLEKQLAADALPALVQDSSEDAAAPQALKLAQIQEGIDGNSALIEYALGEDASYVWIVQGKNISSYKLPPSFQVKSLAKKFFDSLVPLQRRDNEPITWFKKRQKEARQASQILGLKLEQVLLGKLPLEPAKRLLIVPDGSLQYIPFAALPLPASRGKFILAEHEIVELPSASALAALRARVAKRAQPTAGVAIFGDPVFERGSVSARQRQLTESATQETRGRWRDMEQAQEDLGLPAHIPSLPATRREAVGIQKIVGKDKSLLRLGYDANREFVLSGALSSYRVIQFATHGYLDTRHPEKSGLVLSLVTPKGEPQDGYLRLGDIYKLKLSADLVVLSACESALGKQLEAEGIIGLPRGFLYAGARSVIASLWKVDDDATAIFMKAFYTHMQRGESPNRALRSAQIELAKDRRYSAPYYWAAFMLEGDYQ